VRIDMEDSRLTDATLDLYRRVREAGHGGVGVVLQAYLRRSVADVRALADLAPDVRLVKGIYVEPRRVAYQEMDLINRNFVTLVQEIVAVGGRVALATHDERVLRASLDVLEREGVARDGYEIQMLLGVQPALRDRLVAEGHRMRVYVPFGAAWYAYSMRRLKENPSIAGYVARDALRSLVPGAR
jgi:proline dehydrogenase